MIVLDGYRDHSGKVTGGACGQAAHVAINVRKCLTSPVFILTDGTSLPSLGSDEALRTETHVY